jgi:hypothetical protein
VPLPARHRLRSLARLAIVLIVAGLVIGFLMWRASGDTRSFLIVVPPVLMIAIVATHRSATLSYPLLIMAFGSVGWLSGRPVLGLTVGLAFAIYSYMRSRSLPSDFTAETIVETSPDAVGEGAEEFVGEFGLLGYHQVGAYTFRTLGHEIVATVMAGPARDRYAVVTDAILTVSSQFGTRNLVSRNSAVSRMPPHSLDNPVRGASPEELDRSHSSALERISGHARPDVLAPDEVTTLAIDDEIRTLAWIRDQSDFRLPGGGKGYGPLTSHPSADDLITAWLVVAADS